VVPVRLLVDTLEGDRLREADPAHRRRRDEPEEMNEEDLRLIKLLCDHALYLLPEDRRYRQPEVAGQRDPEVMRGARR
jgi:hypothetical protein